MSRFKTFVRYDAVKVETKNLMANIIDYAEEPATIEVVESWIYYFNEIIHGLENMKKDIEYRNRD